MLGYIYGIGAAIAWGIGNVCIKSQVGKLSSAQIIATRSITAIPVAFSAVIIISPGEVKAVLSESILSFWLPVMGAVAFGYFSADLLFIQALDHISLNRAFPIQATYPLITILFAWIFLGEIMSIRGMVGAIIVFISINLVRRAKVTLKKDIQQKKQGFGLLLSGASSICWGIAVIFLRISLESRNAVVVNAIISILTALAFLPLSQPRQIYSAMLKDKKLAITLIIAGGLGGLGISNLLYVMAINSIGVGQASVIISSAPIFSAILAVVLIKEKINTQLAFGTLLNFIGIAFIIGG